ncbi:type i secretion system, outer membrane component lape agga [hydrocarbon metagenome]|uniref:Type i secretion system, outer membrane component lape agga n=1 Tax=hydrocarbon metagenome TaxID=938273 RepID=A0A0W8FT84_9ZZZZ
MKRDVKVIVIFVLAFVFIGTVDLRGETLRDAVKSVLQNNPDITSVAYNRLAREQEVRQAMADFFPKVDSSLSAGYVNQNNPIRDHFWPDEANVRLTQNLFRGGATLSETNRQKSRVMSQAYLLQGASENNALLTCRVYLNYLRAIEQDALAKENLLIHERFFDQIRLRSQAGVDRGVDLEQIKARLALAKSNLIVTQANIENARTDYKAVIGYFPGSPVKPEPYYTEIPATLQEAEQIALDNHPTLKSAKADVEARKFQHKTARALVYPSLDVSAGYTWGNDINGPSAWYSYQDYFQANATLTFNIFNGFNNQARIKETLYLINEAEEIAKKTELQTSQSIRLSYDQYMADQRRIKQLQQYVASTAKTADAYISQWSIGRRTLFDVLDTSAEMITSKKDLINAQYDKMYDSYRILSGLGKLVHTLGLQWPEESRIDASLKKTYIIAETTAPKKVVVVPKRDEFIASRYEKNADTDNYEEPVVSTYEESVASRESVVVAVDKNILPDSSKQIETKDIPKENIEKLVNKWLTSWKSGDMNTYRSCYASDFQSKGKNLNDWVYYKTNLQKISKNIDISINDLQISLDGDTALAVFVQNYSSSIVKDTGMKTLELKKINGQWNIHREIM